MDRTLARLEEGLTDRAEAPAKVMLGGAEMGLAEFLAESRAGTLWGPGQLLILRRADTYPPAAQGRHRLSGPPRAPGLGGAPGRRPEGQGCGKARGVGAAGPETRPWGFTGCGKGSCSSG